MIYVPISTLGNAADFGDLTVGSESIVVHLQIQFVVYLLVDEIQPENTIHIIYNNFNTGNAIDFGDLTAAREWLWQWHHQQEEFLLVEEILDQIQM